MNRAWDQILVGVALAAAMSTTADAATPSEVVVAGSVAVGSHSTAFSSTNVHGAGGVAFVRIARGRWSLGADGFTASGVSIGACCRTALSAAAFSVGYDINRHAAIRIGEYSLNQTTNYPPNTVVSRQSSHLAGLYAGADIVYGQWAFEVTYSPYLKGRIASVMPIAGLTYGFGEDEFGRMVTARALFTGHGSRLRLVYGIEDVQFVAHYSTDGRLADRNGGLVPIAGISFAL